MSSRLNESPLQAALSAMHPPMPKGKEHLVYRDFPKLPLNVWAWVKEVLAPYEMQLITEARYGDRGRGQMFVHPDGLKELKRRFELEGEALFNPTQ